MGRFRVPAGARSRPHYHAELRERGLHALRARSRPLGRHLRRASSSSPATCVYVPPRETHVLENLSPTEPAEYVVARDSPNEDSVEVPWAEDPAGPGA